MARFSCQLVYKIGGGGESRTPVLTTTPFPDSVLTTIFPSFHSVIQALQRQVGMTYTANSEPSLAFYLTSPLPQLRGISDKWRISDYPRSSLHRATIIGQSRPKLPLHSHLRHFCFLNYFYDGCSFVGLHLEASYQSKPKRPRLKMVACFYGYLASYFQPNSRRRFAIALGKLFWRLALLRYRFGYSSGRIVSPDSLSDVSLRNPLKRTASNLASY